MYRIELGKTREGKAKRGSWENSDVYIMSDFIYVDISFLMEEMFGFFSFVKIWEDVPGIYK